MDFEGNFWGRFSTDQDLFNSMGFGRNVCSNLRLAPPFIKLASTPLGNLGSAPEHLLLLCELCDNICAKYFDIITKKNQR